jgi:hypothetical protein
VIVSTTHALPTQHVPIPHAPSPACPQALVQVPAPQVGAPPEQTVHVPPPAPQAALLVPTAHVPCGLTVPGMQQPPLQALKVAVPQALPQTWVARSHASSVGQSAVPLHPHTPPTQAVPVVLAEQSRQLAPQAWVIVSAMQALPTQHAPLPHVPSPACPQAVVQAPPPQVGVAPAQTLHAPPPLPHAPSAEPAAHCPVRGSQQPPLHAVSAAAPHAAPQRPVVVLHAWFDGQLTGLAQATNTSGWASGPASIGDTSGAASTPPSITVASGAPASGTVASGTAASSSASAPESAVASTPLSCPGGASNVTPPSATLASLPRCGVDVPKLHATRARAARVIAPLRHPWTLIPIHLV